MTEIKCIIADDEKPLRLYLKEKLAMLWPELVVCGEARNGPEAVELIKNKRPEIAFLDVRMPGFSGLEVAKEIAGISRIVFITAYDQYAIEAFENEAIDYMLKPVSEVRLEKTVQRLKKQIQAAREPESDLAETLERMWSDLKNKAPREYLQWIKARHRDEIRLIPVKEVLYFKADDKYTVVKTKDMELLIKTSIHKLSEELDPDQFWRIHRGTIIKAGQVDRVSRSLTGRFVIKLKDLPEPLTVSRSYSHHFKHM